MCCVLVGVEFIILFLPHDQVQATSNRMQDDWDIITKPLYRCSSVLLQTQERREWFTDFFFGPKIGLVLFFAHNLLYQFINMAIKITFSRQLLKAFLIFLEAIKSKIKAWRDLMFGVVLHVGSKTTVIWIHKW